MPISRVRPLATAALTVLLLGLAGCGGSSSSTDADDVPTPSTTPSEAAPSTSATPSDSPSESATTSPTASATPAGGPGRCRTGDLRFTLSSGDGGMGSSYTVITMTNAGASACVTGGYGGVSYVAGSRVVGAPATRDDSVPTRRIVLRPGQHATAQLQEAVAENYPAAKCRPTPTTGLRIYPPDETRPVTLKHSATGCADAAVTLLQLQPYRQG